MKIIRLYFSALFILFQFTSASALPFIEVTEVTSAGDSFYRAIISGIGKYDSGVYILDPESGTITFNDGLTGARLPADPPGITANYRDGLGSSFDFLGAIPKLQIADAQILDNDFIFSVSGIRLLELEISRDGVWVTNVEILSKIVPEPATMLLLGTGLAGLAGFRKKLTGCYFSP